MDLCIQGCLQLEQVPLARSKGNTALVTTTANTSNYPNEAFGRQECVAIRIDALRAHVLNHVQEIVVLRKEREKVLTCSSSMQGRIKLEVRHAKLSKIRSLNLRKQEWGLIKGS